MVPQTRGGLEADQTFDSAEKLYRRVPPECLSPLGELVPSHISCSFGDSVRKAPSVVRSKYAGPLDVLHSDCANGKDVSGHLVFYVSVSELPSEVEAGNKEIYDFIPLHDPEELCFAHSVISCLRRGNPTAEYQKPTNAVRNKLKDLFVKSFQEQHFTIGPKPFSTA